MSITERAPGWVQGSPMAARGTIHRDRVRAEVLAVVSDIGFTTIEGLHREVNATPAAIDNALASLVECGQIRQGTDGVVRSAG